MHFGLPGGDGQAHQEFYSSLGRYFHFGVRLSLD